jgi:hypothetical protein
MSITPIGRPKLKLSIVAMPVKPAGAIAVRRDKRIDDTAKMMLPAQTSQGLRQCPPLVINASCLHGKTYKYHKYHLLFFI